jgi:tetratricopeptide (TPR) repeat protein
LERGQQGLQWKGNHVPVEIEIPGSLNALLVARMDRLEEDTRRTVQLAAVIGRSFYYKVLKRVIDATIEVDRELQKLLGIDLIREAARHPELEFQFRHALTQEAAYSSILLRRRREYHSRVAEALETLFSDRLEDHADLLAHHFAAAGDSRAREYYRLAGKQAAQIYANRQALVYYSRALEIPGSASAEETIAILEARGEIYFSLGHFEQALADFEAALELARSAGRAGDENRILVILAWLRWSSGKGAEALELARTAEAGSLASGDPAQSLRAAIVVGTALMNMGDIPGARSRMRQALFANRVKGKRQGRRQDMHRMRALSLDYLATLENFAGRFGRAAVCARKSRDVFLRLGTG